MSSPHQQQEQQQQQQQGKTLKKELQGPRPAPLRIWKDSHKIRKPPLPVQIGVPAPMPYRPPVVIYTHSPEVIHTEAREFMTLVQRLTGRVNAHGDSSMPSSSSASSSFQSQINRDALPPSHAPVLPGNPNIYQIDSSPSPPGPGFDFLVKEEKSIISSSNPSTFSGNIQSQYSTVQSLLSPAVQYGSMSPLSPNFFLPSPRGLLSPNIFKDFPLPTPQPDYLYSPFSPYRHLLRMQSEPIFSPGAFNSALSFPSPPPTDCDLFNNSTSDVGR